MSDPATPPPVPVQSLPYFTPVQYDVGGIWREGPTLVFHKTANLPDLCIKCNGDTGGYKLKRNLSWHHPALFILIIVPGLLIYLIVALVVRNTAKVRIGLCERHHRARTRAILIVWGLILASIAMFAVAIWQQTPWYAFAGIVLLLGGAFYGVLGIPGISTKRIDKDYVWMKGCGEEFLANFPQTAPR